MESIKIDGGYIGTITDLDHLCYWCPKTIKTAKQAIDLFCKNTIYKWGKDE